ENDRETVVKFTKAIYKAQQWVEENSAEDVAEAIQDYFEDTELEMLTATIERYKEQGSFETSPDMQEEGWENLKEMMDEAGELPEDVPYDTLVDTEIAEEVIDN